MIKNEIMETYNQINSIFLNVLSTHKPCLPNCLTVLRYYQCFCWDLPLVLYSGVLLHVPPQLHTRWLKLGHSGNMSIIEVSKCYKSAPPPFFVWESQL